MDVSENRTSVTDDAGVAAFESWFGEAEPQLRAALVATYGPELGRDAAAEALGHAWEHRHRVLEMSNPTGYVFRVGQRWATRQERRNRRRFGLAPSGESSPGFEPALHDALAGLPTRHRQVVVLCTGYGLTHRETADVLGISPSTVQNHAERGLRQLRRKVGQ